MASWREQVKNLRQDGHRRAKWIADLLERRLATPVLVILWIEKCYQGAGIDQDHRPCFLRMASLTPRLLSVEGAVA